MLGFMDYVQEAFFTASHWNRDNSYGTLNATARALLDFSIPSGVSLHLSTLASPNFASSYTLASTGLLDGSLSYLFSSLPLHALPSASTSIPFRHLIPGYRQLQALRHPGHEAGWWWEEWSSGRQRVGRPDTLLYGRLFLPAGQLEALYLRRLSPITQLKIACVSSGQLRGGGSALVLLSRDTGKYSTEYLFSSDSALLGVRGLYNFGPDPRELPLSGDANVAHQQQILGQDAGTGPGTDIYGSGGHGSVVEEGAPTGNPTLSASISRTKAALPHGRFSAGAEVYYGLLNKSGGLSTGIRFATLPSPPASSRPRSPPALNSLQSSPSSSSDPATNSSTSNSPITTPAPSGGPAFPYTMTLTLNPLMGNLSSTYAVRAGRALALCSRFDFNFYSYESGFQVGLELWRRKQESGSYDEDNASSASAGVQWALDKIGRTPGWGKDEPFGSSAGIPPAQALTANTQALSDAPASSPSSSSSKAPPISPSAAAASETLLDGYANADTAGVLKARVNGEGEVGVLWEGRIKELLYSVGVSIDFRRREQIFRGFGVEVQYSS